MSSAAAEIFHKTKFSDSILQFQPFSSMEVKRRTARSLVKRLSSDSDRIRTDSLCELRLLSKHDPDSRLFIADAGAIPFLVQTLYTTEPGSQENAIATLFNISISHREPLMSTPALLDGLTHVLRHPKSLSAVQTAAATVHSLLVVDAYRPIIGAKAHLLDPLIRLVENPSSPPRSIKDGLKALFSVALYPLNRPRLVELGIVSLLFHLVVKDSRIGVVEDSTAVIAQVAGCYESVEAFRKVSGMRILVDLLDAATGSSGRVKENAVSALLNLVMCGGESVVDDIREMGSVCEGLMEVAENGNSKAASRANDLLSMIGERERRFGTVKLTLFLDTSAAFTSFTVSTNSSISSEVVLLDPKGSEPLDSVDQFKRIEFPDINILTENHKMVSEYFDMAERNSATRTGLLGPASFLHLDASSQSLEDYEMAVNSSEENCGGSFSPNGTVQNSGVFSSTTTSLSDDRNSGDSMEKNNRGTRDSSNSALEPHQSSDTSPETPTSKYGNLSRDNSKNSEFSSKGEESAEQGSLGSVKLDPIFTAPLGNINIEDEQTAMQQQIVDMYMRSMQQFTESLAKMKLPMDLNKQESNDGGQVIEGRGNKLEAEKKEGSRVFYGSRAFF